MTTYFSKGFWHNGQPPTVGEVLDALASDASCVENAKDFDDFAADLGYDSGSRKAEKIYKACQHGAARLKKFLGSELYETLLWKTDRQ